jgi:hypothetical protein
MIAALYVATGGCYFGLEERAKATGKEMFCPERMGRRERLATPPPFRDLLLSIAESDNERRRAA